MKWFMQALKKYTVFNGRARRKEFWAFALLSYLGSFIFTITIAASSRPNLILTFIWVLYGLALTIPFYSAAVRRLHDSNSSGWWLLMPFYNMFLLLKNGTQGLNRFGENPRE